LCLLLNNQWAGDMPYAFLESQFKGNLEASKRAVLLLWP
jgi:hypothetical protein